MYMYSREKMENFEVLGKLWVSEKAPSFGELRPHGVDDDVFTGRMIAGYTVKGFSTSIFFLT